jgi:hypothetical protein
MHPILSSQWFWLAVLCSPPLLIALAFALRSQQSSVADGIRIGNPMLEAGTLPAVHAAELRPLLRLTRTQDDAALRQLILGLRHMPLSDTAFILRRYQHSSDPELQLHSQCILQEKQEQLHAGFARLLPLATQDSPANLASCIEAGLRLASSPLTAPSERASVLRKVAPMTDAICSSRMTHPRAVFAAARFCLLTREVAQADELRARLPEGSPLHDSLTALVTHHAAVQRPPPPLTAAYTIR